ncbi:hypothetical protein [Thomasclavelia sp.]
MEDKFKLFLECIDEDNREFVQELNDYLINNNCKYDIKPAKNGYLVSYVLKDSKRTLATFVIRKSGVKLRIYPENINKYQDFLNTLPSKMKKDIKKASICKRLINPDDCNPKCVKGYNFILDDETYQKCRYMAFMPTLNNENNLYIKQFLEQELTCRV